MRYGRAIGIAGTAGRVALGVAFFLVVLLIPEGGALKWHEAALGLLGAPAVVLAWQLMRLRWTTERLDATGVGGFVVNFGIGAVLFISLPTRDAAFLFYGTSLLLAAARGYAGCELLAISNWLLRREDEVGCVVFFPLDAVEASVNEGRSRRRESPARSGASTHRDALRRERSRAPRDGGTPR